uniref:Pentacotripeptide-repeat region of PRORP domain-containing protein n=1 Tax=Chromera velia CCMP2878 TaxID=1169474 RepID=A0A0G4HIW4_9ALVE|eukprot:Cvel_27954.t1-p1 / transcript=Cvel_27954.t1 / gene=Cvel_27954 / organism=Chromera_velia_CCMP2878 / gene_product=Putative pentatricopeptide repeat-containing, putative / transcript_product=Putative pentatricopeptide repeat-containing, putative / location=Cvel_scaffold3568:9230-13941(-) / protein_length=1138 / sequence_SO=supercontig / SO=protein_coding / is_pseudo=false
MFLRLTARGINRSVQNSVQRKSNDARRNFQTFGQTSSAPFEQSTQQGSASSSSHISPAARGLLRTTPLFAAPFAAPSRLFSPNYPAPPPPEDIDGSSAPQVDKLQTTHWPPSPPSKDPLLPSPTQLQQKEGKNVQESARETDDSTAPSHVSPLSLAASSPPDMRRHVSKPSPPPSTSGPLPFPPLWHHPGWSTADAAAFIPGAPPLPSGLSLCSAPCLPPFNRTPAAPTPAQEAFHQHPFGRSTEHPCFPPLPPPPPHPPHQPAHPQHPLHPMQMGGCNHMDDYYIRLNMTKKRAVKQLTGAPRVNAPISGDPCFAHLRSRIFRARSGEEVFDIVRRAIASQESVNLATANCPTDMMQLAGGTSVGAQQLPAVDASVVGAALQRGGQLNVPIPLLMDFFDEMIARSEHAAGCVCIPEAVTVFGILIDQLANREAKGEAHEVYRRMINAGIPPNDIVITSMMKACRHAHNFQLAQRVFDEALNRFNLVPTLPMYTELMKACAWASKDDNTINAKEVQKVLAEVRARRHDPVRPLSPDRVFYLVAFSLFARFGDVDAASDLQQEMRASGFEMDRFSYPSLMNAHAKGGSYSSTLAVFEEATAKEPNLRTDVASWTCLLTACASRVEALVVPPSATGADHQVHVQDDASVAFYTRIAAQLLDEMDRLGVPVDGPAFQVAIRTFVIAQRWDWAMHVYHRAYSKGVFGHWAGDGSSAFAQERDGGSWRGGRGRGGRGGNFRGRGGSGFSRGPPPPTPQMHPRQAEHGAAGGTQKAEGLNFFRFTMQLGRAAVRYVFTYELDRLRTVLETSPEGLRIRLSQRGGGGRGRPGGRGGFDGLNGGGGGMGGMGMTRLMDAVFSELGSLTPPVSASFPSPSSCGTVEGGVLVVSRECLGSYLDAVSQRGPPPSKGERPLLPELPEHWKEVRCLPDTLSWTDPHTPTGSMCGGETELSPSVYQTPPQTGPSQYPQAVSQAAPRVGASVALSTSITGSAVSPPVSDMALQSERRDPSEEGKPGQVCMEGTHAELPMTGQTQPSSPVSPYDAQEQQASIMRPPPPSRPAPGPPFTPSNLERVEEQRGDMCAGHWWDNTAVSTRGAEGNPTPERDQAAAAAAAGQPLGVSEVSVAPPGPAPIADFPLWAEEE